MDNLWVPLWQETPMRVIRLVVICSDSLHLESWHFKLASSLHYSKGLYVSLVKTLGHKILDATSDESSEPNHVNKSSSPKTFRPFKERLMKPPGATGVDLGLAAQLAALPSWADGALPRRFFDGWRCSDAFFMGESWWDLYGKSHGDTPS